MIKIIENDVKNISLLYFSEEVKKYNYLFNDGEHYKLLTYLSNMFNNIIILDLGTCQGHSALALSQNKNNKIITYDIIKQSTIIDSIDNIEFKLLDVNQEKNNIIESAKIILLDIDPHDGIQEIKFYQKLKTTNFKGILLCDDINLNEGMKRFWSSVKEEKYDISNIGHWSGTGLINFSDEKIEII